MGIQHNHLSNDEVARQRDLNKQLRMQAEQLKQMAGGDLDQRLDTLRPAQKRAVAAFLVENEYLLALRLLDIPESQGSNLLSQLGYIPCDECDKWVSAEDVQTIESTNAKLCEVCVEEFSL